MAEEEGGDRGARISAFLRKKTGPLPNGAWVFITAAVLFYVMSRNRKAKVAAGADSAGGSGGTFSSTTTSTNPETGDQSTYTATGPTSGFLQGGALTTWAAQPMGYSGGDVFINNAGSSTDPSYQGPLYPPKNAPMAGSGQTGSWWYTLPHPTSAGDLANEVYQLGNNMATASPGATQVMAADLVNIMHANPQIDWTRVTTGDGKLPAGTAIFVPLGGGIAGRVPHLPANASLAAPAGYEPAAMVASQHTAVSQV